MTILILAGMAVTAIMIVILVIGELFRQATPTTITIMQGNQQPVSGGFLDRVTAFLASLVALLALLLFVAAKLSGQA